MSFTDAQFDRAFAEFQEFGPRRRIRIEERWRQILFDVYPDDYPALRARCEEIEGLALAVAEQVRDGQLTDTVARRQIADKYPFLTPERLVRTWSQAMYFAIK